MIKLLGCDIMLSQIQHLALHQQKELEDKGKSMIHVLYVLWSAKWHVKKSSL